MMLEDCGFVCNIYKRQPCGNDICCRKCEKYDSCKYHKCLNNPYQCEKFKLRLEKIKNDKKKEIQ